MVLLRTFTDLAEPLKVLLTIFKGSSRALAEESFMVLHRTIFLRVACLIEIHKDG